MGNELLDESLCDMVAEMNMGDTCDMPFAYRIGRPDRIVEYRFDGGKKQKSRVIVIENVTVEELADRIDRARMKMENEIANLRKENAKFREAMDDIISRIDKWRSEGSMEYWQYSQLFDIVDSALATTSSQTTLEVNRSGEVARAQET